MLAGLFFFVLDLDLKTVDLDLDLDLAFLKRTWTRTWTCPLNVDLDLDLRTVDLDLHLDLTVAGLVTSLDVAISAGGIADHYRLTVVIAEHHSLQSVLSYAKL